MSQHTFRTFLHHIFLSATLILFSTGISSAAQITHEWEMHNTQNKITLTSPTDGKTYLSFSCEDHGFTKQLNINFALYPMHNDFKILAKRVEDIIGRGDVLKYKIYNLPKGYPHERHAYFTHFSLTQNHNKNDVFKVKSGRDTDGNYTAGYVKEGKYVAVYSTSFDETTIKKFAKYLYYLRISKKRNLIVNIYDQSKKFTFEVAPITDDSFITKFREKCDAW